MKLAVYSLTRDRLHDTRQSFDHLYKMAGMPFDHYVWDNGSVDGTVDYLKQLKSEGLVQWLHLSPDNKGQCIPTNRILEAMGDKYPMVMRYDNDITPLTDGFVAKLVDAQRKLGRGAVVSPIVKGLINPPPAFAEVEIDGTKFFFVDILGGACRLHPYSSLKDFKLGEYGCLALGEASRLSHHFQDLGVAQAYVDDIVVEHPTADHFKRNPEYFERRDIEQYIPYGI